MCRAHATQTICRKVGCPYPIFVEAVPRANNGTSAIIRHPFCSEECARACGENPRPRSVPAIPFVKASKTSQVCGAPLKNLSIPAKGVVSPSSPVLLRTDDLPKERKKGKGEDGTPVSSSRGERDAKLYASPPRTPSDSGSDSVTL
ncbi:hypothetical protein BGZ74_002523 [Mortierella antarctica]|nr:hypothetical protein BGZ74_002523 [Mortierella antarctica]